MTWYGDIYHNGDWFSRAGVKQASPEQNYTETLIRRVLSGGPSGGILGSVAPTLADLVQYSSVSSVGGYTKYLLPWGPCFDVSEWEEPTLGGQLLQPVLLVYMPLTAPPPGGYPVIMRCHANGSDYTITEGSGSIWQQLVEPALQRSHVFCSLEFRHPVPNALLGAPHNDVGYGVQFMRAMAGPLTLNEARFHAFAQSRGNLALWQSVAPDLLDAGSANFAKQKSSRFKAIWGLNTQDSYSTTEFILQKVILADQAACLADPNYADDPRWGSAQQLILNGSQELPWLCATYDAPFVEALPVRAIGRYSKAAIDANGNLRVHCPEFGKALLQAYRFRGQQHKIAVMDNVTGGAASIADCVLWFEELDTETATTALQAKNNAMLRRIGGSAHYLGESFTGVYLSQGTPTPINTPGEAFGVGVDAVYGLANRANTASPLGAAMVQTTASLRPKLASIRGGSAYGFSMDADDAFRVAMSNTTVDALSFPVGEAYVQGVSSRDAAVFTIGPDKLANKVVSLIAAVPNTTFGQTEGKFLQALAWQLSGEDLLQTDFSSPVNTAYIPLTSVGGL